MSAPGTKTAPSPDDPFGLLRGLDVSGLLYLPGFGDFGFGAASPFGVLSLGSPGGAPSPEVPAIGSAGPPAETCECGGQLRRGMNGLEYVCDGCGLIVEGDSAEPGDDDAPRSAPTTARLRIVGRNSNQLQPDLYRSGEGTTAEAQKKQILEEYLVYRQLYIEAGGRAFPINACERASEYYNKVQRLCVKRSQNKKAIMSACLWRACISIGFAPTKPEIAAFMQQPNKGIARGDNFVRSLIADGKMDIEANADPSRAEIVTLFAHLGYDGEQYDRLREAVYEVVQTAIKNSIAVSSILRSKVAGASYVVLRRCTDRSLVSKPMSLQEFCQERIRKNTAERVLRQIDAYHSFFEGVYRQYGLDPTPPR